eukprot:5298039-Pleurochrysis_carterae.AAC.3
MTCTRFCRFSGCQLFTASSATAPITLAEGNRWNGPKVNDVHSITSLRYNAESMLYCYGIRRSNQASSTRCTVLSEGLQVESNHVNISGNAPSVLSAAALPVANGASETAAETVDRLVVCYTPIPAFSGIFCSLLMYTCTPSGACQLSSVNEIVVRSQAAFVPNVVVISGQPAVVFHDRPGFGEDHQVILNGMVVNDDGNLELVSYDKIYESKEYIYDVRAAAEFQIPTSDPSSINLQDELQNQGAVCWSMQDPPYSITCVAVGGTRRADGHVDFTFGQSADITTNSNLISMSYLDQNRLSICYSKDSSSDEPSCKNVAVEELAGNLALVPSDTSVQLTSGAPMYGITLSSTSLLFINEGGAAVCFTLDTDIDSPGQEELYCGAVAGLLPPPQPPALPLMLPPLSPPLPPMLPPLPPRQPLLPLPLLPPLLPPMLPPQPPQPQQLPLLPPPPLLPSSLDSDDDDLSAGVIAGIVIGVLSGVAIIVAFVTFCIFSAKKKEPAGSTAGEKAMQAGAV